MSCVKEMITIELHYNTYRNGHNMRILTGCVYCRNHMPLAGWLVSGRFVFFVSIVGSAHNKYIGRELILVTQREIARLIKFLKFHLKTIQKHENHTKRNMTDFY